MTETERNKESDIIQEKREKRKELYKKISILILNDVILLFVIFCISLSFFIMNTMMDVILPIVHERSEEIIKDIIDFIKNLFPDGG